MSGGFTNKPKILRGAFVEYGLSLPPLAVIFQFNPVQLSRSRSITYSAPGRGGRASARGASKQLSLKEFHKRAIYKDLLQLQRDQQVDIAEETISFDIRLDATDNLNDGNLIAEQFGIAPQLATLELMVQPKDESTLGKVARSLFGERPGFSFTKRHNPPLVLFIWGRKRVLPVNISSMNVTETDFSTDLNPLRASVAVSLSIIEGPNPPFTYAKALTDSMSALNIANLTNISNLVIPG